MLSNEIILEAIRNKRYNDANRDYVAQGGHDLRTDLARDAMHCRCGFVYHLGMDTPNLAERKWLCPDRSHACVHGAMRLGAYCDACVAPMGEEWLNQARAFLPM